MYEKHPDIQRETGPDGVEHAYVGGTLAFRMFFMFAAAYILSYGFRVINAVIAQPLVDELHLSSTQLGLLASAYFLAFAVMQLPLGVMLDRYGPRRVESALMVLAAAGALMFSMSHSFLNLWLARALIGIGASACLMAAVKAYSLYFRPHMQASLSSWMLMAGSVGAISVTTPVEALLPTLGWRGVFAGTAVLCLLASALLWFALPALFKPQKTQTLTEMINGYKAIFKHRHFWRIAPLATINQGGFMAYNALWIGPWFTRVEGVSNRAAAQNMFWISVVLMLGYMLVGVATRRISKAGGNEDQVMMVGMGLSMVLFLWQIIHGEQAALWPWLAQAFFSASSIMTYSICNKPFPKQLTGRSSTALNLMIFVGAFGIQWGIGAGIDLFLGSGFAYPNAMRATLLVLLVFQAASWVWYVRPGRQTSHL